jgi:DNA polymerase-3 subunit gamma/tau
MTKGYRVLARQYRPQSFADLMGQEVLVTTLKNAIESQKFPHAILLTGVRGTGKTTTARLIARSLNCVGPDGKGVETITPCGECEHCKAILDDRHLDVIEMDAASRTSVEDIRRIIDSAYYKPSSARYKVQIIDEVHMLTKQAFNALLKTLEEPPSYTKFVFATTEIQRIPDTIISRCIRFDLKRFDRQTLKELLQKVCKAEKVSIEAEALSLLAQAAGGSARDALSLLERAINLSPTGVSNVAIRSMLGLTGKSDLIALLNSVLTGNTAQALTTFDRLYTGGSDPAFLISALCDLVHEITRLKISEDLVQQGLYAADDYAQLTTLAQSLSIPILTRLWQVFSKGQEDLRAVDSSAQATEMILIRACYLSDLPTAHSVITEMSGHTPAPQPIPVKIDEKAQLMEEVKQTPLVKKALEIFPDAEIKGVKPLSKAS